MEPTESLAILSTGDMYRADAAAIAGGISGATLMENAGRAVAVAVRARFTPRSALVLCGPGNNGGDGFAAARHLLDAGWPVRLALLGPLESLKGDAAHHAQLWTGPVEALTTDAVPALLRGADLVIDALFGAGLARPLEGAARVAAAAVGCANLPVVAIDVPSGVSGDSGAVLGDMTFKAALTVTFFRKKPGHLLLPGRSLCGDLVVADIGIAGSILSGIAPSIFENTPSLWIGRYPWRGPSSHKYDFGHALVLGGAVMTGAGRLAARAALRVGAGLVTVACPRDAVPIYARSCASLIVMPSGTDEDFAALLSNSRRNAVLIGPGLGQSDSTQSRVLAALGAEKAVVLDADALTSFSGRPEELFEAIKGPCVLTPHEGEFARLFPDIEGGKLQRAQAAAARSGAVVLLKGGDTVIAAPDGQAAICSNGVSALATAGTGDVLAGLIVGLVAQGMDGFDAACAASWLHGEAGAHLGPGLIADDLPEALPAVLRRLALLRQF